MARLEELLAQVEDGLLRNALSDEVQRLKRLRLDDIDTRDKVRGVKTGEHIRQLFEVA